MVSIFSKILLLIGLYNYFANGSSHGYSDCGRAYVYRDSYNSKCFKEDGFNDCGFTNKFMLNDFDSGALNLGLYLPRNDYDDCCNINNLDKIGEVSFYYSHHSGHYSLSYSLLDNNYHGYLGYDIYIGKNDDKYPKNNEGHYSIDFEHFTINEELSDLVDSSSFNEPFSCDYSLYLIASAVVCKKPSIDECDKYDPYYIKPCSKDPCPCNENYLCKEGECKENGCNQCKDGTFQKGRDYPCIDCKEFFGEGCMFCNDEFGCAQCESGYYHVNKEDAKCGLSYCVKIPSWHTPNPTKWTPSPTKWKSDPPTSWTIDPTPWTKPPTDWTEKPTYWTREPTDPPSSWTAPPTPWTVAPTPWTAPPTPWTVDPTKPPTPWSVAPTPWTKEPTDPPTPWTREPTLWTAAPTPWTREPTSWTPSPTDKCNKYTEYYIKPCSKDPCPCDENYLCNYNECKENGCNQCKSDAFQKGREYPCIDCKKLFGEGCMFCNDFFGCAQCEEGYMHVPPENSDCGLGHCVQLPTPKPTPWTRDPTDHPTSWTAKPTPWTKEPTDPPSSWTAPPTPWTKEPTDPPTKWTPSPTPWTVGPTSWTSRPTSWTPSPIDPCQAYDPYYIEPCSYDPCPCYENMYCSINECKENGCNKCKDGYFQKGREYPCTKCDKFFGEGCMFCNDYFGCAQCKDGYTLVSKEDAKCGLSYCEKNSKYY